MLRPDQIGASTSCLANYDLPTALATLARLGFAAVELLAVAGARHSIGWLPGFWFETLTGAEREALRQSLRPFRGLSVHAPFVDTPLFTYNSWIARESLRQVRVTIEGAGWLGARVVVVHVNRHPYLEPRDYWTEMLQVLRSLGEVARPLGVQVGIETGYPDRYDLFVDLIHAIRHPAVGATLDVGHVAYLPESGPPGTAEGERRTNANLRRLCRDLGEKIVHIHLHDVRRTDWRDHRALGTGFLDLPGLIADLDQLGYSGLLQLELEEEDQIGALRQSQVLLARLLGASRGAPEGG